MLAAPEAHQFACLDKSTTRLLPVRCELWRGLVFINLDPDAEIGRASCRERVCQYGVDLGGRRIIKKKIDILKQRSATKQRNEYTNILNGGNKCTCHEE